MSLDNLNKLYIEIQTIELQQLNKGYSSGYVHLSVGENYWKEEYRNYMVQLQEFALTDILSLSEPSIIYHINRLNDISQRIAAFKEYYAKNLKGENRKFEEQYVIDFLYDIDPYFITITYDKKNQTEDKFIKSDIGPDLNRLMHERWHILQKFTLAIEEYTTIKLTKIKGDDGVKAKKRSFKQRSYNWFGTEEELRLLYKSLVNKFIINTREEDFIGAFSGKAIGEFKPINWHNDNTSEVLFFIKSMTPELIPDEGRMNYRRLVGCFVKSNGDPFDGSFKTLNQSVEIELSQQKQKAIKAVIDQFL